MTGWRLFYKKAADKLPRYDIGACFHTLLLRERGLINSFPALPKSLAECLRPRTRAKLGAGQELLRFLLFYPYLEWCSLKVIILSEAVFNVAQIGFVKKLSEPDHNQKCRRFGPGLFNALDYRVTRAFAFCRFVAQN